jgi:oligosaccharyltransferase complex subunit alpha (ribophorin I)
MTRSTHVTYLDSVGRPAITFAYEQLTDKHLGTIYVTYKVSTGAHLKKIVTVAGALFSIFVFAMGVRRVDLNLTRKK